MLQLKKKTELKVQSGTKWYYGGNMNLGKDRAVS